MSTWNAWVHAARLRTLPLALSCVLMGGFLAYADGRVDGIAFMLAIVTTVLLQVLSNFANDYGDYASGVDLSGRVGPVRALQGGHLTMSQMKSALFTTSLLAFISGLSLLLVADIPTGGLITLLMVGLLAIIAAITYTIGKRPYGYIGLGDLSVFIFFGMAGVLGSHYVINGTFDAQNILLAASCGFFSVGVLNLNNIRDLEADKVHHKNTLPVWLGRKKAVIYHIVLLTSGWMTALGYHFLNYTSWHQFIFVLALPFFVFNVQRLISQKQDSIDPLLKQLALSTLLFVLLHGLGWVIA